MAQNTQTRRQRLALYEKRPYLHQYRFQWHYLHPRHWLSWAGMGLYWIVGRLPFSAIVWLGRKLGALAYRMSPSRVRIAHCNVKLCFPEKSTEQIETLVRENFANLGVSALEPGIAWWASRRRIERLVRIEGMEHIYQSLRAGRGVLLCAPHMLSMEMALRGLGEQVDLTVLHRVQNNPIFQYMSAIHRRKHTHRVLSRHCVRDFIYLMRTGRIGLILPDQDLGKKHSIFVPFFGIPAATTPSVSRFSAQADVDVIPGCCYRDANHGYVLTCQPALVDFPTKDITADTAKINTLMEHYIRQYPEQYLWQHRRFKHRPPNEPSFY